MSRNCSKMWTTPYDKVLNQFDLPSLQSRRKYSNCVSCSNTLVECPLAFRALIMHSCFVNATVSVPFRRIMRIMNHGRGLGMRLHGIVYTNCR